MKIKLSILDQIFKEATAKEIDFLIYVVRFQSRSGTVSGISANAVCAAIHIHRSHFNNIIRSLEKKGIIWIDWSNENARYWTIKLIGNIFWNDADYREGYINLNTRFLYDEKFLALKKNEKIIMLKILSQYRVNRNEMTFTWGKLMEWTGSQLRSVKKYIKTLQRDFFDNKIVITDKKVSFSTGVLLFGRMNDETDFYNEHELEILIKETNAEVDEAAKKDVVQLFKQFGKNPGREVIVQAILTCIYNQGRKIIAPYVNKMIGLLSEERRKIIDAVHQRIHNSTGVVIL